MHVFVENDSLRATVTTGFAGGELPYSSDESDVDVVPVIGGIDLRSVGEVFCPAVMVDVTLNVGEEGLTVVGDEPL